MDKSTIISVLLSKIEKILEESGKSRLVKIPDTSLSYNVVACAKLGDDEKKILIKAVYDVSTVSREELIDMAILSKITCAIPIIVGVKESGEKLKSDTVYRKLGISAVSIAAFRKVVKGEPIRLVKDRGIVKAKIRGEELRKRREQFGMSLGDVAEILHVSRKTVYEYERGTFEASERTARILMQIFGEDIIEKVDIEPKFEVCRKYMENRKIDIDDISRKYSIVPEEAYKLEKTHGKLVMSCSESEKYMVVSKKTFSNEVKEVTEILEVKPIINGE